MGDVYLLSLVSIQLVVFTYTYSTIQSEAIVLIPIGVVLLDRVLIILLRHLSNSNEYGYWIPRLGVWGVGQESLNQSLHDAEWYVERE